MASLALSPTDYSSETTVSSSEAPSPILIVYDGSDEAQAAISLACELLGERSVRVLAVWQSVAAAAAAHPGMLDTAAITAADATARREADRFAAEGAMLARARGFEAHAMTAQWRKSTWATILAEADRIDAAAIVVKTAMLEGAARAHCSRPVLVAGHGSRRAAGPAGHRRFVPGHALPTTRAAW
jgi:nucleotide-binding universal stress UspA family protein